MKLAVLADIHANLPALEQVVAHIDRWQPDAVVVAGDLVNRGPMPLACLRLFQERQRTDGWRIVRGNHEEYVLAQTEPDAPVGGPLFEIFRSSLWTLHQLDHAAEALTAMPFQQSLVAPDGSLVRVTHASMRGTRDGIFPDTSDAELRKQIGRPLTPLFCVGHTHLPLIRRIDSTLVVNVGAVGLPFDGDPRASYGRLTWRRGEWQAEIVRLPYDRQRSEQDFIDSGFLDEGGALALLMLRELRLARSQLYQWAVAYERAVNAEEISLAQSVACFIADYDA